MFWITDYATGYNQWKSSVYLQENQPVQLDDRVQILSNGLQLEILNTTVSDTGRYSCVARNPAGQDSLTYSLQVLGTSHYTHD